MNEKRYIQLTLENSNNQFLKLFDSSNKFFGPLNITHFFRQKNSQYFESQYLEYLGRSNKIVGPLDNLLSFSRTFVLTFRPKFKSSIKFERFIRFFGKKYITKVFSFSYNVFLRKMALVKRKLRNNSRRDIEETLDKLQNLSLFSSYGDEIRSLTLKIETFLNKEQTEGLKESHLTDFFQAVN